MKENIKGISRRQFFSRAATLGVGIGLIACGTEAKYTGPKTAEPTVVPTQVVSPTPETVQKLTPKERITTYAKEVLKPEFTPQVLQDIVSKPVEQENDQTLYYTRGIVRVGQNQVDIVLSYVESIKSDRFKEDGLPLDLTIAAHYPGRELPFTPPNAKRVLDEHFINSYDMKETDFRNFTIDGGSPTMEAIWDNKDGTKESRWVSQYKTTRSDGSALSLLLVSATRIFKYNPLYEKNTAHEKDA